MRAGSPKPRLLGVKIGDGTGREWPPKPNRLSEPLSRDVSKDLSERPGAFHWAPVQFVGGDCPGQRHELLMKDLYIPLLYLAPVSEFRRVGDRRLGMKRSN